MSWEGLAVFLREELKRRGMQQQELQGLTGIPDSTLSRILNGQVDEPRASQIAKIGQALNIPFWRLMQRAGITDALPDDPDAESLRVASILQTDPELQAALDHLARLDARDRQAVHAYIELLKQQRRNDPLSPPESQ